MVVTPVGEGLAEGLAVRDEELDGSDDILGDSVELGDAFAEREAAAEPVEELEPLTAALSDTDAEDDNCVDALAVVDGLAVPDALARGLVLPEGDCVARVEALELAVPVPLTVLLREKALLGLLPALPLATLADADEVSDGAIEMLDDAVGPVEAEAEPLTVALELAVSGDVTLRADDGNAMELLLLREEEDDEGEPLIVPRTAEADTNAEREALALPDGVRTSVMPTVPEGVAVVVFVGSGDAVSDPLADDAPVLDNLLLALAELEAPVLSLATVLMERTVVGDAVGVEGVEAEALSVT